MTRYPGEHIVRGYLRDLGRVASRNMPHISGWFRELDGGRLEVFLKVQGVQGVQDRKVRASGPAGDIYEVVSWFEEKTGMRVDSEVETWRRKRTGPKPMEGQMALIIGELSS